MFNLGNSLASLNVKIGADTKQFSRAAKKMEKAVKPVADRMKALGKTMSLSLTAPIVALGAVAVRNFDKQAKAIAQVEQGVKSTGGTAGFAATELQKMAQELQGITTFGDEEILQGVTAQILTFTNIAGEQFARTQKAVLDLSARIGTDLTSASIQLGKALNDPVANLGALSRSGIQFSASQKEVIKSLADSGRLAEAQTIILDELEKQYGGAAEAAAKAGLGPFKQLSNTLGDLSEEFGEIIAEGLRPLVGWLKEAVEWFSDLSKETKRIIVIVASVTAAFGPLLFALGTFVSLAPLVAGGWALISGPLAPITALLTALGVAMADLVINWETRSKQFVSLWQDVKAKVLGVLGDLSGSLATVTAFAPTLSRGFRTAWSDFKTGANEAKEAAEGALKPVAALAVAATPENFDKIVGSWKDLAGAVDALIGSTSGSPSGGGEGFKSLVEDLSSVPILDGALGDQAQGMMEAAREKLSKIKMEIRGIRDMADMAAPALARTTEMLVGQTTNAVDQLAFAVGNVAGGFESLGSAVKRVMRNVVADVASAIAKVLILKGLFTVFGGGTGLFGSVVRDVAAAGGVTSGFRTAPSGASAGALPVVLNVRAGTSVEMGELRFHIEQDEL